MKNRAIVGDFSSIIRKNRTILRKFGSIFRKNRTIVRNFSSIVWKYGSIFRKNRIWVPPRLKRGGCCFEFATPLYISVTNRIVF